MSRVDSIGATTSGADAGAQSARSSTPARSRTCTTHDRVGGGALGAAAGRRSPSRIGMPRGRWLVQRRGDDILSNVGRLGADRRRRWRTFARRRRTPRGSSRISIRRTRRFRALLAAGAERQRDGRQAADGLAAVHATCATLWRAWIRCSRTSRRIRRSTSICGSSSPIRLRTRVRAVSFLDTDRTDLTDKRKATRGWMHASPWSLWAYPNVIQPISRNARDPKIQK